MSYVTAQDFLDRLGKDKLVELTDRDATGEVDNVRLSAAAEAASSTFDSYAFSRYRPPISVTAAVKQKVLDLAIFELISDLMETDEGRYKIFRDRWQAALKWLADIQSGKASLEVAPPPDPSVRFTAGMNVFQTGKARRVCPR